MVAQPHGGALRVGNPGNGGRPTELFRARVREAAEDADALPFLVRVVKGEETDDQVVTVGSGKDATTQVVQVRPKLRDRILASELLIEHGYGKAPQKLEVETHERMPTFDEAVARMTELLPNVLPFLPVDKRAVVRALERRRIAVPTKARGVKP